MDHECDLEQGVVTWLTFLDTPAVVIQMQELEGREAVSLDLIVNSSYLYYGNWYAIDYIYNTQYLHYMHYVAYQDQTIVKLRYVCHIIMT